MSRKTVLIAAIILAVAALALLVYLLASGLPGSSSQLRELDANAQKWESQHVGHYRMNVHIGCFCPFFDRMPVTVEVLDGEVVSVIDSQGRHVPQDDPLRAFDNAKLMTVQGVFAYAREAIRTADETTVSYDAALGYPVSLSIGRIKLAMDDELAVRISELQVLP